MISAPEKRKDTLLRRKYGISLAEYKAILESQEGVCAICQGPQRERWYFCVDHDHETDELRGLLCYNCNLLLGGARDNIRILARAIEYLEEWSR